MCIFSSISPKMIIEWSPSLRGHLKWNFDGSPVRNPSPSGFGGLLWDDEGKVCWVSSGPLGSEDLTRAELLSFLFGLREIKSLGKHGCLLEGDS